MQTSLSPASKKLFRFLPLALAGSVALVALAEPLLFIDASDPNDPQISYDEDPYLHFPDVPEYPTVIYPESGAGALGSTADPYTGMAPVVKTSEPDTYSLSPASVYYTAPAEPPGPNVQLAAPISFDFGPGPVAAEHIQVRSATAYDPAVGYGWGDVTKVAEHDKGGSDAATRDYCRPNGTPFYVDIPNGNYRVSFRIEGGNRSMRANGLLEFYTIGGTTSNSFPIKITNGRLRLEMFGSSTPINSLAIRPIPDEEWNKPTIFLASDSTVANYAPGFYLMGWGQPLHKFFTGDVVIDNQAKPGRSSKSFVEEGSLATIANRLKPGDYLFVMFAINDSADDNSNRKTRADSTFKAYMRVYVDAARTNGAIPVFVPAQIKCTYDLWGRFFNSVQGYPQAMRELGAELNVPVLDLNRMSIEHLTAIGVPEARSWYATNPSGGFDYIHLSEKGAHGYAGLVAKGIKDLNLPIAQYLIPPPSVPAGLAATAVSSTQIDLSWAASASAGSYNVKRATSSAGPYTTVARVAGTSHADTGLAPGTTYYYVVSAVNALGESADSAPASAATLAGPSATPTGLAAVAGNQRVELRWNSSAGATGYNVKRSTTSGGPYAVIASPADTGYLDTSVVNGTTYYYVVSAANSYGESADSSQVMATPATAAPSNARYEFEGNASDTSGNGYHGTASASVTYTAGKVGPQAAQFDGASAHVLIPRLIGTNFTIALWVKTTDTGGTGAQWWSGKGLVDGEVSGNTADFGSAVLNGRFALGIGNPDTTVVTTTAINDGAWHHVAATRNADTGEIRLYVDGVLNNSGTGPTGARAAAPALRIGSIQTGAAAGFLNGAIDEVRLYDRALADAEIALLASGAIPPSPPAGLTATTISNSRIDLSWTAGSGATSYNVKRATTSGGPYAMVATGVTATSHADMGLSGGTTYYYVVSAASDGGESADSSEASATTMPAGTTYSGRATVLNVNILGVTNSWSDTGALPTEGGAREASLLSVNEPELLAADVAHAAVIGQGDRTRAEVSAARFALQLGDVTVGAEFVMARAEAVWQTNGTTVSGSSEVAGLVVNGAPVVVTGEPNQTVLLLNGHVIINEQIATTNAIIVNALHIIINGAADVVASSAQAGIAIVTPPDCDGGDYITGGGWITTPDGAKGNFSVAGGIRDGVLWGHLNYKDQGSDMTVKATSITVYQQGSTANSRRIEGTAEINGASGYTFAVEVTDNGNPGAADVFAIALSNGYLASGTLGGGNIQLHQPCE
ncbi:MAG: choice-of-anchor P family protein [Verrucomicrobiota bacterium]